MRYDHWLNLLAGLHMMACLGWILLCAFIHFPESRILYLSMAAPAAVLAYGFWFRRLWIRAGVIITYGIPILLLALLAFWFLVVPQSGPRSELDAIVPQIILLALAGTILVAGPILWFLYGRGSKQIFGEMNTVRFGYPDFGALMLILASMIGGLSYRWGYQAFAWVLVSALIICSVAYRLR